MTERASGHRLPRSWTEAEIEAIAAADTEFPPISEDDLARALAAPKRAGAPGTAATGSGPAADARIRKGP